MWGNLISHVPLHLFPLLTFIDPSTNFLPYPLSTIISINPNSLACSFVAHLRPFPLPLLLSAFNVRCITHSSITGSHRLGDIDTRSLLLRHYGAGDRGLTSSDGQAPASSRRVSSQSSSSLALEGKELDHKCR